MKQKVIMGVAKSDGELIIAEWDGKEWHGNGYRELCTDEYGKAQARETLEDSEYWEGIGFIGEQNILHDFIDFEAVADRVISVDGWQMTNGEWEEIGTYEEESVYANFGSGWSRHEEKEWEVLFITEKELAAIQSGKPISNTQDTDNVIKRIIEEGLMMFDGKGEKNDNADL